MSERTLSPDAALAAIVKSAQYLGGMVSHQDLWPQLGRLIRRFFATDVAAFASRREAAQKAAAQPERKAVTSGGLRIARGPGLR